MNAPVSDIIALPARINAAGCKAVRDTLTFPDGYSNFYAKGKPYSANVNELMANHADAGNHALIRDLMATSLPVELIAQATFAYWFRDDYNVLLHNTLLIIDQMHRNNFPINMPVVSSAVGALSYPDKEGEPQRILTHTQLDQAVAIVRFILGVGEKNSSLVSKRKVKTAYYYTVANPHLETLLRDNPDNTEELITILKDRDLLRTKKGLAPVLLALHNDEIKALIKDKPEVMDKMFEYYYDRNPGDATDIAPLLGYLNTANAVSAGYL